MKQILKKVLCIGTALLMMQGAVFAAPSEQTEVPILMYHHFATEGPYTTLTMSPEKFLAHMQWLRDNGFTAILPSELELIASGELPMPQRPIVITIDDGYKSNYELAFPVLKQTGMRVGIALVTSMMWGQGWGMDWNQVREMSESGLCEFGSHTNDLHDPYGPDARLGVHRRKGESHEDYLARVIPDLEISVDHIETELQQPCKWLCYPFGANDPWLDEYLQTSGMFPVTTIIGSKIADIENGLRNLNRVRVGEEEPVWKDAAVLKVYRKKAQAQGVNVPVSVNGWTQHLSAYCIEGTNYVRLRDLAALLSDTAYSFNVRWEQETRRVCIDKGLSYTSIGGELSETLGDSLNAVPRNEAIMIDGNETLITAYNFHGTNYVNLRWISRHLGFTVGWDEASRTVVIS